MRRSILTPSLFLVIVSLVCGSSLALEGAEKNLVIERPVGKGDSVIVENLLGSVRVVPAESPGSVRVEAQIVAEAKTLEEARALVESIRLEPRREGQTTRFHVEYPVERFESFRPPKPGMKGMIRRWTAPVLRGSSTVEYDGRVVQVGSERKATGLAVHLTVTLPYELSASVRQSVGSIEARALRGRLRLETVDGDIAVDRCYGVVQAESQRGEVRVSSFQGAKLDVTTQEGNMELADVRADTTRLRTGTGAIRGARLTAGDLIIDSASGDVKLGAVEPTTAEVTTESGKVDLASYLKHLRDAVIRTATGDVTLRVGDLAHFDLQAESKSGMVKTLGGVTLALVAQDGRTTRLQHGQGGTDLRVSAPEGSVTVRPFDGSRLELLLKD
jgi:hypothetical protein